MCSVTIYHNPKCGTSRNTLALIRPPYLEKGLDDLTLSDDALIAAMLADPILINRPIVVTEKGVRLCRPSEVFLQISPCPLQTDFIKEDGNVIAAETK